MCLDSSDLSKLFSLEVRAAIRTEKLGKINADPFKMIIATALCWTLFGFITDDVYIIASNLPGVNLGLYYYTVAYGLTECTATRRTMETQVPPRFRRALHTAGSV